MLKIKLSPKSTLGGLDTSDATATQNDIIQGKTAYGQGEKITGTLELPNIQINKQLTISQNGNIDIQPDAGFDGMLNANVTVDVPQPTGTISISENGTYDVTGYASAEVNVQGGGGENYAVIDVTKTASTLIYEARARDFITEINIKDTLPQNSSYLFNTMSNLENVNQLDTIYCTSLVGMFSKCPKLKRIPQINTSNVREFTQIALNCSSLEDFPILDMHNVSTSAVVQGMVLNCPNLTNESLNNIMASLATSQLGSGNTLKHVGISSSQATVCTTLSNWETLFAKGWTTGY